MNSAAGVAFALLLFFFFLFGNGVQAAVSANRTKDKNGGDITAAIFSLLAAVLTFAAMIYAAVVASGRRSGF